MGEYWAEMADKNQTTRQLQFLKRHLKAGGYVLDLACGSGRHTIPLSREGYSMVGVDVSPRLLAIAKGRLGGVQVVRADLRFLPFRSGAFAAAVSMDTSVGYLPSEHDDLQSLLEAQRILAHNGVLVVDVFNHEQLVRKYSVSRISDWMEYPSFWLRQKRQATAEGLRDEWIVRDKASGRVVEYVHSVRLYRVEVLRSLLEQAGFVVEAVFGDYEGQPFNAGSSRLVFLARARQAAAAFEAGMVGVSAKQL